MANSINMATLQGRVGVDPEVRTTSNGARVANFSLATSETRKDKTTGEKREGGRTAPENVGQPRTNVDLDDEIPF